MRSQLSDFLKSLIWQLDVGAIDHTFEEGLLWIGVYGHRCKRLGNTLDFGGGLGVIRRAGENYDD